MQPEFIDPDFIEESDPEIIHERMMENLPEDISDMPGDFAHDFTMPAAIEISQLIQFNLQRSLMIAFPEYAWGEWLELHGKQVHVTRHPAQPATGYVVVTGEEGIIIEQGAVFCVPAVDDAEAIEFEAVEAVELTGGEAVIPIIAVEAGRSSNVAANTVTLLGIPRQGILSITNPEPISDGKEEEDDDSLYDRIHEEYKNVMSYTGNDTDYIRWAKEVGGVGDCIVVPEWDGPGTVKLVLTDSNGTPASEGLKKAVYDHIVCPEDRSRRLLPAGCAKLTVEAAKTRQISYVCTGMVLEGVSFEEVIRLFKESVRAVYAEARKTGVLRYNDVRPVLADISGLLDFEDFLMDGGHGNIVLEAGEYADTGTATFTQ